MPVEGLESPIRMLKLRLSGEERAVYGGQLSCLVVGQGREGPEAAESELRRFHARRYFASLAVSPRPMIESLRMSMASTRSARLTRAASGFLATRLMKAL